MSCLKTLCNSSIFVSFSSFYFFNAFENHHLKRDGWTFPAQRAQADEKSGRCGESTPLFGEGDKALQKATVQSWNLRRHATQKAFRSERFHIMYMKTQNDSPWCGGKRGRSTLPTLNYQDSVRGQSKGQRGPSGGWNSLDTGYFKTQKIIMSKVCFYLFWKTLIPSF